MLAFAALVLNLSVLLIMVVPSILVWKIAERARTQFYAELNFNQLLEQCVDLEARVKAGTVRVDPVMNSVSESNWMAYKQIARIRPLTVLVESNEVSIRITRGQGIFARNDGAHWTLSIDDAPPVAEILSPATTTPGP